MTELPVSIVGGSLLEYGELVAMLAGRSAEIAGAVSCARLLQAQGAQSAAATLLQQSETSLRALSERLSEVGVDMSIWGGRA